MSHIRLERRMDAPPAVVWGVITDHDLYAEAAPNLASVEVLEGEAETMVRRCVDTDGNAWTERCTGWEDGQGFAVSVDVAESDFHRRLFSRFEGEWRLREASNGVVVTIEFDFAPKYGPLGWLISAYFRYKAPGLVEVIFDRWAAEVASRRRGEVGPGRPNGPDRGTNALYP